MTEQSATVCRLDSRPETLANTLGFGLSFSAMIATCGIVFFTGPAIPIENPATLIFASLFILVPFKQETLSTIQKIICFYLFSITVNQLSVQYFTVSIPLDDFNVSYSIIPLLLCGSGYLTTINTKRDIERENIFYAWILTLIIIIVHIIFLSLILNKFYGYGYERNISTMGNLVLYLLLAILLWEKLGSLRFRQSMGLVSGLFYLSFIFTNK